MGTLQSGGRKLKQQIRDLLRLSSPEKARDELCALPARQVINPLISFLYSTDALLKWRAVTAIGTVVARLARTDQESARVIMRRFMWNLNDESGGIGWGSPEAMGAIIAESRRLAREYTAILVSYIQPGGNYLEIPGLQHGAIWAIGRAAHARPGQIEHAAPLLVPFMTAEDPTGRGLAAWAAGPMGAEITKKHLTDLTRDPRVIPIFLSDNLEKRRISDLATEALTQLPPGSIY